MNVVSAYYTVLYHISNQYRYIHSRNRCGENAPNDSFLFDGYLILFKQALCKTPTKFVLNDSSVVSGRRKQYRYHPRTVRDSVQDYKYLDRLSTPQYDQTT
jgi:hypothetical protein